MVINTELQGGGQWGWWRLGELGKAAPCVSILALQECGLSVARELAFSREDGNPEFF